jgi:hypothetical protein
MNDTQNAWLDESRLLTQLTTMLELQNDLNAVVFPDWASRNLNWHRAIYVEAAEYLDHLGAWKWWKKGTPDFVQANLELVDIWHFALAYYLNQVVQPAHCEYIAQDLKRLILRATKGITSAADPAQVDVEVRHQAVDRLVATAGAGRFDLEAFVQLLGFSGMSFDALYRHYVGKNVLNVFRQEHGYKSGAYARTWGSLDDNAHLEAILESLPIEECSPLRLRVELLTRYQDLVLRNR